ncbi:MAG TPA: glycosyltransferase [Nevskiaceae bacterium]|nr:glycosyltransferase [Nevskiaceae bacterium]
MSAGQGSLGARVGDALLRLVSAVRQALIRLPFRRGLLAIPRRLYHGMLAWLVKRTGLFDADYYVDCHPDVLAADWDPLAHYVRHGDHEGCYPMPLFDPAHYREQLGTFVPNALLHYAWVGQARGLAPNPWFDPQYYVAHHPDAGADGADPMLHYLREGADGRSPSAAFDAGAYQRAHPEVVKARANPLAHYLRRNWREKIPWSAGAEGDGGIAMDATRPTDAEWEAAVPRLDRDEATVDVVVPVYKGVAETLRCLLSVLSAPDPTPFALIVIDDASPEPELADALRRLADRGLFTLLANERNRGFVHTANRGMALHAGRDVVLLNADTEVYGNWLERLRAAAYRHPRTATVTPLSNSATICSYPRFCRDNPVPLECGYAELDHLAARHNAGFEVEAPTGIGFCLYLRRDALAAVGLFDEDAFGRGYGEENDLCQRLIRKGWRNVLAADVFVRHWGAASFAGERPLRIQEALRTIARKHPKYDADVQRFCAADPLARARRALDWQRLVRQRKDTNVLIVCHARGGGTERQVRRELAEVAGRDAGAFLMRPSVTAPRRVVISHPNVRSTPNLAPIDPADTEALARACRDLGIVEVHVHSLVDLAPSAGQALVALVDAIGARLEVRVHDYEAICPRLTLSDATGRYCGEPDAGGCNNCLRKRGSEFAVSDIRAWRTQRETFMRRADRIVVPDEDVSERLLRYFPGLSIDVVPHDIAPAVVPLVQRVRDGAVRIVVVGAISRHKGFDILRACADHAKRARLPLKFVLMGFSIDDQALRASGVEVMGRYVDEEAPQRLRMLEPDAVWIPSTWPETYSFTLSLALRSGVPTFAFDLGAVGRRLRAGGQAARLLPRAAMADPSAVNAFFLDQLARGRSAA